MLSLGGEVVARDAGGERTISIDELLQGPFTTALEPTEVITEVRVPRPPAAAGSTYLKLERKVGDFATVAAAVALELDDGAISRAGIALTAVGPKNLRAEAAEGALGGAEPGDEAFEEAARLAAQACEPNSDVRGSAEYKRAAARTLVKRGLQTALEKARGA
jgi:carbon-monoxide dehydrogenase medium subunit